MGMESRRDKQEGDTGESNRGAGAEGINRRRFLFGVVGSAIAAATVVDVASRIDKSHDQSSTEQPHTVEAPPCPDELTMEQIVRQEQEFLKVADTLRQGAYDQLMDNIDNVTVDYPNDEWYLKPYATVEDETDSEGRRDCEDVSPPKDAPTRLRYSFESDEGPVRVSLLYWFLPRSATRTTEEATAEKVVVDTQEVELIVETPTGVLSFQQLKQQESPSSELSSVEQLPLPELLQEFAGYETREVGYRPIEEGELTGEYFNISTSELSQHESLWWQCQHEQQRTPNEFVSVTPSDYDIVMTGMQTAAGYFPAQ